MLFNKPCKTTEIYIILVVLADTRDGQHEQSAMMRNQPLHIHMTSNDWRV